MHRCVRSVLECGSDTSLHTWKSRDREAEEAERSGGARTRSWRSMCTVSHSNSNTQSRVASRVAFEEVNARFISHRLLFAHLLPPSRQRSSLDRRDEMR